MNRKPRICTCVNTTYFWLNAIPAQAGTMREGKSPEGINLEKGSHQVAGTVQCSFRESDRIYEPQGLTGNIRARDHIRQDDMGGT